MFDVKYNQNPNPQQNDLTSDEIKSVLKLIWTIKDGSDTPLASVASLLLSVSASISCSFGASMIIENENEAKKFFKKFQKLMILEMNKAYEEGVNLSKSEENK